MDNIEKSKPKKINVNQEIFRQMRLHLDGAMEEYNIKKEKEELENKNKNENQR
jgi:hypothetical protein